MLNPFRSTTAALFLEFWKRYSSEIAHRWDVTGYQPEAEHPRPEYIAQLKNVEEKTVNFVTQTTEPKVRKPDTLSNFVTLSLCHYCVSGTCCIS